MSTTRDEILVSLIAQLNPQSGLGVAKEALRQARLGDYTMLHDRFNVPIALLKSGASIEEAVRKARGE